MHIYGPDMNNLIFLNGNKFVIIGDKYIVIKYILELKRSYFYMFEIEQNKVINLSELKSNNYLDFLESLQHALNNIIFL